MRINSSSGFSILELLVAVGVGSFVALGLATLMTNYHQADRNERIRIARDQLVRQIATYSADPKAFEASLNQPGNDKFTDCMTGSSHSPGGCVGGGPSGTFDFTLYEPIFDGAGNPAGARLTGFYKADGTWCNDTALPHCPIQVETSFTKECIGANCRVDTITWTVGPNALASPRPALLTISGQGTPSGESSCPPGEYIVGYDEITHEVDCDPATAGPPSPPPTPPSSPACVGPFSASTIRPYGCNRSQTGDGIAGIIHSCLAPEVAVVLSAECFCQGGSHIPFGATCPPTEDGFDCYVSSGDDCHGDPGTYTVTWECCTP